MSSGTSKKMHVSQYRQNSRQCVADSRRPYSYQDRIMQLPFPYTRVASPSYLPVRVFLLDSDSQTTSYSAPPRLPTSDSHPRVPRHASRNHGPARDVSKLTQEEQQNALSKVRNEMNNPVMLSIMANKHKHPGIKGWEHKTQKNEEGKMACAICLEDFEVEEVVTLTPCNHMFHNNCIVPWVKTEGRCPICRFAII